MTDTGKTTSWTPGPWQYDHSNGVTTPNKQRLLICGVAQPLGNHPDADEAEANARLVSAAPDLLVLLDRITQRMNRWASHGVQCGPKGIDHDYADMYNLARAAIRKAKGEL